jgi:CDP-diacylglycerol--serine O-phosphatidyltransferase
VALLVSYPWPVLTLGTLAYLACLPFGWLSYRRLEQAALRENEVADPVLELPPAAVDTRATVRPPGQEPPDDERPTRLN